MRTSLVLAALISTWAAQATAKSYELSDAQLDQIAAGADFAQTNLVSNQPGLAANTNPNVVNPWGLAQTETSPLWVSDNGSGKSTVHTSTGASTGLVVNIPAPGGGAGAPTGAVTNPSTTDFAVSQGGKSGASRFLFATEDGTIAGWSPSVNANAAVIAVNQASQGAVFKGLTIAQQGSSDRLFAADFANGRVDVFDNNFRSVGSFTDPSVPAGFAPFNVQNVNGALIVTFAKRQARGTDDQPGRGNGIVDVFDTSGTLIRRLATGGTLNSPWGVTLAPANFGQFSNALLVGNFGDGRVNAFDPVSGRFLGQVTKPGGQPLTIDGLWALHPTQGRSNSLTFSAGPNGEKNGLIGTLKPTQTTTAATTTGATTTAAAAGPKAARTPVAMHGR